jgi:hypothetical protein
MKGLKTKIKEMKKKEPRRSFRWFVLNTIEKEGSDNVESFINDVLTYGCLNGTVGALTYTSDIHRIFDKYYYDIDDIIASIKEELGEVENRYDLDVKTFYTFLAFEETVREIAEELGLNI